MFALRGRLRYTRAAIEMFFELRGEIPHEIRRKQAARHAPRPDLEQAAAVCPAGRRNSLLEQLFNASDIAVVGNFTGADKTIAVAAVGANSALIALIVNLFIGIALGANVVIANAVGRGDREAVQKAVHTSIVFSLLGGIVVAVLGELAAAALLRTLHVPDDVFPQALLYLRIYLMGMPVILLYNFEAAIFRSVGETRVPLVALAMSGVLNVLLNLFFVAVLHMTVNGVAIATVMANAFSWLCCSAACCAPARTSALSRAGCAWTAAACG